MVGILAVGQTAVVLNGGIDVSVGALLGMVCIRNGLNLLGIDPCWQGTAVGCIIVAAVASERILSERQSTA